MCTVSGLCPVSGKLFTLHRENGVTAVCNLYVRMFVFIVSNIEKNGFQWGFLSNLTLEIKHILVNIFNEHLI